MSRSWPDTGHTPTFASSSVGGLERVADLVASSGSSVSMMSASRRREWSTTSRALRLLVGDRVHLGLELARHLGGRDALGVLRQGGDDRDALAGRLDRLAGDVLAVGQRLDDVVTGRLRPEAEPLHLLDELARRVARGRLRLLRLHLRAAELDRVALDHRRQVLVLLQAVRVDGPEARARRTMSPLATKRSPATSMSTRVASTNAGPVSVAMKRRDTRL